jgi:hypothetical protein
MKKAKRVQVRKTRISRKFNRNNITLKSPTLLKREIKKKNQKESNLNI